MSWWSRLKDWLLMAAFEAAIGALKKYPPDWKEQEFAQQLGGNMKEWKLPKPMCEHLNFRMLGLDETMHQYDVICNDCGQRCSIGMASTHMLMRKVFEQEERIKKLEYALANFLQ